MITSRSLAVIIALSSTAYAGGASKAWTSAKAVLPPGLQTIGGVNLADIRSSAMYQALYPKLLEQAGSAKTHVDTIKKTCSIDVLAVVDSLAIGLDASSTGTIVVAFKGATRKDFDDCAQKIAKDQKKTVAISNEGSITTYSVSGEKSQLFAAWLATDVVAISTSPDDKASLVKATKGGLATDATMKPPLAKVNTGAGVWGVVNKSKDLRPDVKATMSTVYGSANVASGTVTVDGHVVVDNAAAAKDVASMANSQLDAAKKSGQIPPQFADLVKAVSIKSAGNEVLVTGSAAEKQVLVLVATLLGGMH